MSAITTYEGGCHCGAVRFAVEVGEHRALECNCSICNKKGFIHLIVTQAAFRVLQGGEHLTTYTFSTGVAKHTFCRICGIHPFYTPRSHPDGIDVNVRCLDGDVMGAFTIEPFDGRNWDEAMAELSGKRES
jgi:hypothetical protein